MTINYQLLGNDPMLAEMGQTVPLNYILKKVTVDSKTTTYWVPKNNDCLLYTSPSPRDS